LHSLSSWFSPHPPADAQVISPDNWSKSLVTEMQEGGNAAVPHRTATMTFTLN
jgi:hypothetical protein